jgi:hypothetical protein
VRIHVPAVPEGFEWVVPAEDADAQAFLDLDGTPRAAGWVPVPVRLLTADTAGRPRRPADLPWLASHLLVLREPALAALRPVLADYGELLPLACPDAPLWVFNALRFADALDEAGSELVRFGGGRVMAIERHAFRSELVEGIEVFRLPQLPLGWIYFGEKFVRLVRESGLRGTEFPSVWAG